MNVILERTDSNDEGTFGRLHLPKGKFVTGELPWRDNKIGESCIPLGVYECVFTYSPTFRRNLYLVTGVPNRQGIRFHAANFCGDATKGFRAQLNGCIALGMQRGKLEGQNAVLSSRLAMQEFEAELKGRPFTLEVLESENVFLKPIT